MKKLLVLLVALAMIISVKAMPYTPFTSGWASCTPGGGYGGWNQDPNTCHVAWAPPCTGTHGDATFTVGTTGMTTTKIIINHLDGASNDSFQVLDGSKVLCSYADSTSTETWMDLTCNVNFQDVKTLTLQTTGLPGPYCEGYGQVAVSTITFDAEPNTIPEFGIMAGAVALVGALGIIVYRRKS